MALCVVCLAAGCATKPVTIPAGEAHVSITPQQKQAVLAAIRRQTPHRAIHIIPDIPARKLATAQTAYVVAPGDEPLALLDGTTTGSAKYGILITTSGIYINNSWESYSPGRSFISYSELLQGNIHKDGEFEVFLTPTNSNSADSLVSRDAIIKMMDDIRAALRQL